MFGLQRRAGAKAPKLHSIAATMSGRTFRGSFDVAGVSYTFTYSPAQALLTLKGRSTASFTGKRRPASTSMSPSGPLRTVGVQLSGNLTVIDKRPGLPVTQHSLDNVVASFVSAQGGIGTPPARKKTPADIEPVRPDLPIVESTGALSFCGVLYFKFSPLDGRALGIPADLNALQLNVRLAPVNDAERNLQGVYSSLVDALLVKQVDMRIASEQVKELNKLLTSG